MQNHVFKIREGTVLTKSREETVAIGEILGSFLRRGDVLCLDGDLGAGKTAFTSGIAKGLGIHGMVSSPTFTILIEHPERELSLYHFDAYRLEDDQDFYDLGFDEYFSYPGVCVIEWSDRIQNAIPEHAVYITLKQGAFDVSDQRVLTFSFPPKDARADDFFEKLEQSGFEVLSNQGAV